MKNSSERSNRPTFNLKRVVDGGYCIGCGACAAVEPKIEMRFDEHLRIQAFIPKSVSLSEKIDKVCPFSDLVGDEDEIARSRFNSPNIKSDAKVGRYLACYAGWANESDLRSTGSSGGIGTWLQLELLRRGLVDAVVNVTQNENTGTKPLFSFEVSRSDKEVMSNSKTRYYPVEMSGVIKHMLEHPGRYAVIGTPCFVKALRLVSNQTPALADRLSFVLGIVCGHLKTAAFAQALAWQCGVDPLTVQSIDFRRKLEDRPASRYGVSICGTSLKGLESSKITRPMEGLWGANWGHGVFKYKACDFCDDVLGETADAVVGDAWLPRYDADHLGTNILIVRDPKLHEIILTARDQERLHLDELSANEVAASQAGGLRHRREGLQYRLWLADQSGQWRPKKRVDASKDHLSPAMRRIHRLRSAISELSHTAFHQARTEGDFNHFERELMPLIELYERQIRPSILRRIMNKIEAKLDGF